MTCHLAEEANICEFGMESDDRCRELYADELVVWNETDTEATTIKLCREHLDFATMVSHSIDELKETE